MRNFNPFAPVLRMPLFGPEDAGAGAGGGAGAGAGGGSGAGAGGAGGGGGSGAGAGGAGGGTPLNFSSLTPETRVIGPDGKETTYGEYSKNFVPRTEHEGFVKNYRTELKNNLARLAQSLQRQGGGAGGDDARPGATGAADPFADIWSAPLVDGPTLKRLADAGFGSLAQQINKQQVEIAQMKKQFGAMTGGFNTLTERNLYADFDRRIASTITATVGEGYEKDPFLREVAEDVWHSHENWTRGKEDAEFQTIFKNRLDAMEKFIRARDKKRLTDAKAKPFWQRGGGGTPSAPPKFDPAKTNRDRAAALFGSQQNT